MTDDWLWGWDATPGIVSVCAEPSGEATVWRRVEGAIVQEYARFRPWLLLDRLDDLRDADRDRIDVRELRGDGALRYLATADDGRRLTNAVLRGARERLGHTLGDVRDLGRDAVLSLPAEEQYLVATGRTYFGGLTFDDLRRLQFDLETTGLDATRDRIFMIAVRLPDGATRVLEAPNDRDDGEAALIRALLDVVRAADPDVVENHNLHGFDLPFLDTRGRRLGVPIVLGRVPHAPLRTRAAMRGSPLASHEGDARRVRYVAPGRELIDTLDAVRRYDFATRDLPGHGLKAVAKHLGIARPEREYVPGAEIYATYRRDPERVRRYATDDVEEVAALSRLLGGAAFALAQLAPRRYERLADAGPATGVIDPLLVRAYLRAGVALPAHEAGDGTAHTGAALHLFAVGVAERVVKADVASLYPSLMRAHRIGPARDSLGALLALVDALVERRLAAKAAGRAAPPGSAERHAAEAMSAAMKLVVNSAYGYLAASGEMTRFADVHAANEVTRRGRETLALMCRELARRGVTLLEADTDGVYFSVPHGWTEDDERRAVQEVGALLPPLVRLELEGRYAAMLSHEPKNYALLHHDGTLVLRGVAFRSSRAEPFAEAFLRRALRCLLSGDVLGVRSAFVDAVLTLRRREYSTYDVSSRVRLTKTPEAYAAAGRRELAYEAVLASGRTAWPGALWARGERVRVYRTASGGGGVVPERDGEVPELNDPRDYDVEHYVRVLRDTYASRLARGLTAEDYEAVVADPGQMALFERSLAGARPVLTPVEIAVHDDARDV